MNNLTPKFSIGQEVWCLQLDADKYARWMVADGPWIVRYIVLSQFGVEYIVEPWPNGNPLSAWVNNAIPEHALCATRDEAIAEAQRRNARDAEGGTYAEE